jgi:hypothetical protein
VEDGSLGWMQEPSAAELEAQTSGSRPPWCTSTHIADARLVYCEVLLSIFVSIVVSGFTVKINLDLLSLIGKKNAVMSSQRSLWKRRCVIVPEV